VQRYDAATASCIVYTYREGLLAAVGHDLALTVTRFSIELDEGDAIRARFDASSLRAPASVSAGDRRTIERHAADDVLAARRWPEIAFRSTAVTRGQGGAHIAGELTLHGTTRPLALDARDDGAHWTVEARLDQRDFGIKPFSAMLGTLRVRPDVLVRVSLPSR
jgi:polyisoprenoid-binding protein YceI